VTKQMIAGYMAELEAKNKLIKKGYFAVRTAGSKSCVDIIAINTKEVLLIQVKSFGLDSRCKDYTKVKSIQFDRKRLKKLPKIIKKELWIKFKGEWIIEEIK